MNRIIPAFQSILFVAFSVTSFAALSRADDSPFHIEGKSFTCFKQNYHLDPVFQTRDFKCRREIRNNS